MGVHFDLSFQTMKLIFLCMLFGFVILVEHPGDELEPTGNRRRSPNAPGKGTLKDWAYCSKKNPCGIGEGDCDGNDQCKSGLQCGVDNCKSLYPDDAHPYADCCVVAKECPPEVLKYIKSSTKTASEIGKLANDVRAQLGELGPPCDQNDVVDKVEEIEVLAQEIIESAKLAQCNTTLWKRTIRLSAAGSSTG